MSEHDARTSQQVIADFYQRHPYPAPETNLDGYRDGVEAVGGSPAHFFHLFWPQQAYREDLKILVAGSGTSQAVKYALQCPGATVTGIDLSEASLAHSRALAEKYQTRNLTLRCLPIEQVSELEQEFDLVVSTGVLHHLPDPARGLRALREVLLPDGVFYLMVYAHYGRTGIYMLQDYCRRLGIKAEASSIAELQSTLKELAPDHPLQMFAKHTDDLQYPAGVADALLNPQDRAYTVPQLYQWLESCNTRMMRWFLQAPYSSGSSSVLRQTSHGKKLETMSQADQHAAMELYRGTLLMHRFIACRDDRSKPDQIDFADPEWPLWVPTLFPGAQQRPVTGPGSAQVEMQLWHPGHGYRDCELNMNTAAAALWKAIDGKRNIAEIAALTRCQDEIFARSVFSALWDHDQVLFYRP